MIGAIIDEIQAAYPWLKAKRREDGGYALVAQAGVAARIIPQFGGYLIESRGGISHMVPQERVAPHSVAVVLRHAVEDGLREMAA